LSYRQVSQPRIEFQVDFRFSLASLVCWSLFIAIPNKWCHHQPAVVNCNARNMQHVLLHVTKWILGNII